MNIALSHKMETQDARRRIPPPRRNAVVRHERDPKAHAAQMALLACGLILACGFVYAAAQQFAAVRYGYRSESLRREREQLIAEHRRLELELDEAASPAHLAQAARSAGLDAARPAQIRASGDSAKHVEKVADDKSARRAASPLKDGARAHAASVASSSVKSHNSFDGAGGAPKAR